MGSTGNSNLDLDFKIRIPDLQSNAKSENGRFSDAEICVLEFPFFLFFFWGGGGRGWGGESEKEQLSSDFPIEREKGKT